MSGWKTGAGSCPRGRRYGSAAIAISEIWDLSPTPTATSTFKFAISIRPSLEIPSTTWCAGVVVGVGGPRIGSAGRDHRQDARRNDERLRSGAGRTVRRPNGKETTAETDPRGSRPRGSPQVAATG